MLPLRAFTSTGELKRSAPVFDEWKVICILEGCWQIYELWQKLPRRGALIVMSVIIDNTDMLQVKLSVPYMWEVRPEQWLCSQKGCA